MKEKFTLRKATVGCILMAGILAVSTTGCMKKELFAGEQGEGTGTEGKGEVTLDNYFDFSTRQTVQLTVDYGKNCPKAYFEVYAENPLTYQEEGAQVIKREDLEHLVGGFTDGEGRYSRTVTIPAAVTEVYIYSPDFGVPQLYRTEVTDKAINAVISFDNEMDLSEPARTASTARAVQSRAMNTKEYILERVPNTLGGWDAGGRPDYLESSLKINITSKLQKYITTNFPDGKDNKKSPYISHDSDILIKERAKVWVNYFGGDTSAQSVFAYYCYKEGDSKEEIKKAAKRACIIFPNAHKNALGAYSGVGSYLRYIDETGALHDVEEGFPAGVKIGVLIWNRGFNYSRNFERETFYSTKSLNSDNRSHTAIFAATSETGQKYNIITMEDWTDTDYNDVAFIISSNPIKAIEIPDAPDPEDNRTGTNTYCGLLGFEDNWPRQGDYDMNDVVIKYHSVVTYNSTNSIIGITDHFTLTWTGASLSNGFSYQVPFDLSLVNLNLSEAGATASTSPDNVINVFNNARQELGVSGMAPGAMPDHAGEIQAKTYTISMTFNDPYSYGVTPPYNPFIRMGATEVHLPNQPPTANANNVFPQEADISDGKSTFFICQDGFPFAIHMDARADETMMNLDLTRESMRIDEAYPKFKEWVQTRNPQVKWW